MIKKLVLTHFQCHKKKSIEFSPGVNVIIGPSDTGKSSIIRALKWVVFNKPSGNSFRRHGSKRTVVKLLTNDHEVIRTKSNAVNTYKLDGKELKTPGTSVPAEVENAINLKEINFQEQHDAAFMLSETAGECGRMLNRMVDLEIIDKTLKNLNRKGAETKNKAKYVKEETEELKEEVRKYRLVKNMAPMIEKMQNIKEGIYTTHRDMERIEIIIRSIQKIDENLSEKPDNDKIMKHIERIEKQAAKTKDLNKQVDDLHTRIFRIQKADSAITNIKDEIKELQDDYADAFGKECPLCHQKVQ